MTHHPKAPRLQPLTIEEMSDDQRELVGQAGGRRPLNIFATLVRAPGLYRRWSPFAGKLLRGGKLSERERELVILRTAFRCAAPYEWGQHVSIARAAGITDDEIQRVADAPDGAEWDEHERFLLRAVDELLDHHCLSDGTWDVLATRLTEAQLIELLMLSGHYALLAGVLNSLGVPPDGDLPALGQVGRVG